MCINKYEIQELAFDALIDGDMESYFRLVAELRRHHDDDNEPFSNWWNRELQECRRVRLLLGRQCADNFERLDHRKIAKIMRKQLDPTASRELATTSA